MIGRSRLNLAFVVTLLAGFTGPVAGQTATVGGQQGNEVTTSEYALSARVLSKSEVSRHFVSEVYRGHVVVEVTLKPIGGSIDVRHLDFHLLVPGETDRYRADGPAAVAAYLQESAPVYRDITVTPEVGVAYQTGTPPMIAPSTLPSLDPNYDSHPSPGTVGLHTGVGIRFGENTVGATAADRKVMETELSDKGLPEGTTSREIVGYLYFRMDHRPDRVQLNFQPLNATQSELELLTR